ncbi:hypothetical protein MTo_00449 [Microcystis aeruginosa NIES-1211]|jgi:hypothetical protein|uniref:Ice-binding protein C-terminal domain-containing protein n=1 Tax=Microcystis aeruginosa NIES-2519 TaxID=2303981 RepID=A0A5A5R3E7_MICAE|nr:choice-of-anchor R domain-containing protein [Microcystis aeruginosa]GBL13159.1 hypothetical protein MTo_00449 [Microcystis aeruginosa NIES-1211]GCA70250.1 hypothetical protein MiYa_01782 [Microcystis aeruginosa NIES-2519]
MKTSTVLKNLSIVSAGATSIALATMGTASASIIFDGGGPDQQDGNEMTQWVQTEDFILSQDIGTRLTDVHFWTFEDPGAWDGTLDYFVFANAGGQPAGTPFAQGAGANVVKTATGNQTFGLNEYAYSFDLQTPLDLSANTTYWLGLHLSSNFDRDEIYWSWSTTTPGVGSTGQESFGGTFNNWSNNGQHHAFYLTGQKVPEPASVLGLLAIGALGAGAALKRKLK